MTKRLYHFSTKTNEAEVCGAGKGQCPYGKGEFSEHIVFNSVKAANAWADEINKKLYGADGNLAKVSKSNRAKTGVDRVHQKAAAKPKPEFTVPNTTPVEGYLGVPGWEGGNRGKLHNSWDVKEIAQNIREDVKDAKKAGFLDIPNRISVRQRYGTSIDATIQIDEVKESPLDVYEIQKDHHGYIRMVPNAHYKKNQENLKKIMDSYNYNKSNPQVDYFNNGFYGFVDVDQSASFDRYEKSYRDLNKAFSAVPYHKRESVDEILNDPEVKKCAEKVHETTVGRKAWKEFTEDVHSVPFEKFAAESSQEDITVAAERVWKRIDGKKEEYRADSEAHVRNHIQKFLDRSQNTSSVR